MSAPLHELDIAAGRVLYALKHAGAMKASKIPTYALGIVDEQIAEILERLRARGAVSEQDGIWSAV